MDRCDGPLRWPRAMESMTEESLERRSVPKLELVSSMRPLGLVDSNSHDAGDSRDRSSAHEPAADGIDLLENEPPLEEPKQAEKLRGGIPERVRRQTPEVSFMQRLAHAAVRAVPRVADSTSRGLPKSRKHAVTFGMSYGAGPEVGNGTRGKVKDPPEQRRIDAVTRESSPGRILDTSLEAYELDPIAGATSRAPNIVSPDVRDRTSAPREPPRRTTPRIGSRTLPGSETLPQAPRGGMTKIPHAPMGRAGSRSDERIN